jgi:hypothetical protein
MPYGGAKGPLHLLIPSLGLQANHCRAVDSTGIKVEGEGEWSARKHGGPERRVWCKIHIGTDEQTLEIRSVKITGSNTGDAPMLPHLLNQILRSAHRQRDCGWRIRHAQMPQRHRRSWSFCGHPAAQKCPTMEANYRRCDCQKRRAARFEIYGSGTLAELERIPPTEPRRDKDALHEAAGPAPDVARL